MHSQHGIDIASSSELLAHGKTRREIAELIKADDLIYQDLDELKAACFMAAGPETQIKDFEVGVFCGKYQTPVPEDYLTLLNETRGKKRKFNIVAAADGHGENGTEQTLTANGGVVNVATARLGSGDAAYQAAGLKQQNGSKEDSGAKPRIPDPEHREDIRYVVGPIRCVQHGSFFPHRLTDSVYPLASTI